MLQARWPRLPKREVYLFLVAALTPCLVLAGLGLWTLRQERQLAEKRASDERQRRLSQVRQELLVRLDRIKLEAALGAGPDREVALVAKVRQGQLLLPWKANLQAEGFREFVGEPRFAENLRKAEREEFVGRIPAPAAHSYQEALDLARWPAARVWARLQLARALRKAGQLREAHRQYEEVMQSAPELVDEHGVPLALYAAHALLDGSPPRPEMLGLVRELLENHTWQSPTVLYMLRELAGKLNAPELLARLDSEIPEREQAEALKRDFPRLTIASPDQSSVWVLYGERPWLVSVAPGTGSSEALAVAVRASQVLARISSSRFPVELAPRRTGEPLGEEFPGLHVTVGAVIEPGSAQPRTVVTAALALALIVTTFAAYLVWRDVRRELGLAALRSHFVSSVSHELKTPLTAIRMFTEAMWLEEDLAPETRSRYLATILQEADRLTRLVDNVLDFAKIEQGQKVYRIQPASLAEVVEAAACAVDYPLKRLGFQLEMQVAGDLPLVPADRDALEQAILNLLSNAMKYSAASREIGLRLAREDDCAVIRVVDHGVGIPAEQHRRIFERYYRVPSPENERLPGTGLGLTLVDHIVKAHGGNVEVESRPGEGSIFTIRLPLGGGA